MASAYFHARPQSQRALQVVELLARYPVLTGQELKKLIKDFPKLSLLEQGLLTADDHLSAKVAEFRRHHGELLESEKAGLIAFLAFPILVAAGGLFWAFA